MDTLIEETERPAPEITYILRIYLNLPKKFTFAYDRKIIHILLCMQLFKSDSKCEKEGIIKVTVLIISRKTREDKNLKYANYNFYLLNELQVLARCLNYINFPWKNS